MTDVQRDWEHFQNARVEACGITLDYSRTSLDDRFFKEKDGAARDALAEMADLEQGAIANPSEKRMVGHYWLRAPDRVPDEDPAGGSLREIPVAIRRMQADIRAFAADVHTGRLTAEPGTKIRHALLIGIGGSALGPQLVGDALGSASGPDGDPVRLWFLDNTDPDGIDRTFAALHGELAATLAIVISKSGGTKETANGMVEAMRAFGRAGLCFERHAVAVTGVNSELDKLASGEPSKIWVPAPEGDSETTRGAWIRRFPMWDWVGGRTSQTAAVGLLPAALQGIDVDELLEGARCMDEATRAADPRENPAMVLALTWLCERERQGNRDMVLLPYKDRLVLLARYLQQLVMESLGKKFDRDGEKDENIVREGIAVYGNKGSTDQHSYVQQLRDGLDNFFVTFVEVQKDRSGQSGAVERDTGVTTGDYLLGFLLGTRKALWDQGRKSLTLTLPVLTPFTLGATIALYERAVGLYANLVNINAYDQPGVEAGKLAAGEVLKLQYAMVGVLQSMAPRSATAEELAAAAPAKAKEQGEELEEPVQIEVAYKVLEHLAANDRGVRREGGPRPGDVRFSRPPGS